MGMIGNTPAAGLIGGGNIQDESVDTIDLKDAAVTNAKIASGVDASKLTTGTLPIARVADGTVVNAKLGTDLDASKLTAGTLPTARLSPASAPVSIQMGDSGGTAQWMYLGQWDTAQMGYHIHIRFNGNGGFNADINQSSNVDVFFKTSNNSSSQAGSSSAFYGDGYAIAYMVGAGGVSPSIIRVVQTSSTSYKFYAFIAQYSGAGSYFAVDVTPGTTWTTSATWATPTGNYVDLVYRNMLATTTTGGVANQSNAFVIPINPAFVESVVYVRGRHDTGVANGYLGTQVDGSQVVTEANNYSLIRGTVSWTDTSSTTWTKMSNGSFTIDQGLDWGGVFVVRQRHINRPAVMIDFQYVHTGIGGARTVGSTQYNGSGGSITGLIFDWDCNGSTPNLWADWRVVGIK